MDYIGTENAAAFVRNIVKYQPTGKKARHAKEKNRQRKPVHNHSDMIKRKQNGRKQICILLCSNL